MNTPDGFTDVKKSKALLKIKTLGDFSVSYDGDVLSGSLPRAKRMWKLFKYLLTNNRKAIPTDTLVGILWDDDDECENPTKALYSLIHRLRSLLGAAVSKNSDFIFFQHGSYICNPYPYCSVDAFEFEALAKKAERADISQEERIHYLLRAISLYKGDYLRESAYEEWILPVSSYYRRLYISLVEKLCDIYDKMERYEDIIILCEKAIAANELEEAFHIRLITALMNMGRIASASAHYEYISKLLYRELGVEPCIELQTLNSELHSSGYNIRSGISEIKQALREPCDASNAFYCDFETFRQFYQLQTRTILRSGQTVFLGLISISSSNGGVIPPQHLASAVRALKSASLTALRKCDVIAQYSGTQFVYLLPNMTYEDGSVVEKRIRRSFNRLCREREFKLDFQLNSIDTAQ